MRRHLVIGTIIVTTAAGLVACSGPAKTTGCRGLTIAAAPDIAPALAGAAARFDGTEVGGHCVRVRIDPRAPAQAADGLSGTVEDPAAAAPDVWVPDSSLWIPVARRTPQGTAGVTATGTSLASSPVVWAMPAEAARALAGQGAKASWKSLIPAQVQVPAAARGPRFTLPEPAANTAGLASLLAVHPLAGSGQAGLLRYATAMLAFRQLAVKDTAAVYAALDAAKGKPVIAVTTEQSVAGHNQGQGASPVVAAYPVEGTIMLDYPYVVTTRDRDRARAAAAFRATLGDTATTAALSRLGFRAPDGTAGPGLDRGAGVDPAPPRRLTPLDAATTAKIRKMWNRIRLGARLLDVMDVSPSMGETVPGTETARIDALSRQIQQSFALTPDFVEIGMWEFSTRLKGKRDYRVVAPIRRMGATVGGTRQRDLLLEAVTGAKPEEGTYTGLYDTVLAAFREVSRDYRPDVYNVVTVFTDGVNNDPYGGLELSGLLRTLKREYDPKRPVNIVIGAYGPGNDVGPLRDIAKATGGQVYLSQTPREAERIFRDLLVRMLCTGSECPVS
ncbi:substrate-binding domain-containing protein [Actinomadura scrupuli]|uniref:substrate-binding domain-containing protein n=1 Tax=Actinomadura scrupuli TaxID=559629 RepID=UPI003D95F573